MAAKPKLRGNKWVWQGYIAGKKRWISADTRGECEERIAQAIVDRKKANRTSEPCESFAARWASDYPRAKESTNLHNHERVQKFGKDFTGTLLCDIDRITARRWSLENPGRWKNVRAMFTDAVRDGLAPENPFLNMRMQGSRGRKDIVVITPDQLEALLDHARSVWGDYGLRVYAPMIQFAAYSGLRPGELYGLQWADIDFKANTVFVQRQYNVKVHRFTEPKNGLSRLLYLTPPAAQALSRVPRQREEVFFTPRGKMFTGRVQHYYWNPVRIAAGMIGLDWYEATRHFFGTYLANMGLQPYDIAQAMGHQDGGKLALERYIHVGEQDARARIAAAFRSNVRPLHAAERPQAPEEIHENLRKTSADGV
jgi:integrase